MGVRSFTEFIIAKIKNEGLLGSGYGEDERENDIIDMIWEAYEEFTGGNK